MLSKDLKSRLSDLETEAAQIESMEDHRDLFPHEWQRLRSLYSEVRLIEDALKKMAAGHIIRYRGPICG